MTIADSNTRMEEQMERVNAPAGGLSSDQARSTSSQSATQGDGTGLASQAASQVRSVADRAKTTAQDKLHSAISSGKKSTVETLSGVAQSLSIAGQQLRDQQNGSSQLVDQAAEQLDRVAKYLDTAEVDELVHRTESWARRNPAIFLGGAFVLGVLGGRFLKSSKPRPQEQDAQPTRVTFTEVEVYRPLARTDL